MMQRMQCTLTEFREQPYEEICIFEAFVRGEFQAKEMMRLAADAKAGTPQA